MEGLSRSLAQHLVAPRGAGIPEGASAAGRASNAACGDELVLHVGVGADGRLVAGFQARACSATLAVASLVCERLAQLDRDGARALDLDALVAGAGGLPPARRHALELARRALDAALSGLG